MQFGILREGSFGQGCCCYRRPVSVRQTQSRKSRSPFINPAPTSQLLVIAIDQQGSDGARGAAESNEILSGRSREGARPLRVNLGPSALDEFGVLNQLGRASHDVHDEGHVRLLESRRGGSGGGISPHEFGERPISLQA